MGQMGQSTFFRQRQCGKWVESLRWGWHYVNERVRAKVRARGMRKKIEKMAFAKQKDLPHPGRPCRFIKSYN